MKTILYSRDIECDSCIKVLGRALKKTPGVQQYDLGKDEIVITHDDSITPNDLIRLFTQKGYRASLNPELRPRIRDRAREFITDKQKYATEYQILGYVIFTGLVMLILEFALLMFLDARAPGTFMTYVWWVTYLAISIATLTGALWHFLAYRTTVTCMTGMMIGMTIGMQTGMLLGAIIGATNGFFAGAMAGMLLGSSVGALTGKCCGIMGLLEGVMSGIMGGTMGAMITVMMFTDRILWFMPFYVSLNLVVLAGFSYMLFEELVEGKQVERRKLGFLPFAGACILAALVLNAIMFATPAAVFLG